MFFYETYATSMGVDKICIMVPSNLPLGGQYKFEAYVHKAHENGSITISLPSLRALTVDDSFEQVGIEPLPCHFLFGASLIVLLFIGVHRMIK